MGLKGYSRNGKRISSKAKSFSTGEDSESKIGSSKLIQWTTPDGIRFIPSGETCKILTPGLFEVAVNQSQGLYFSKYYQCLVHQVQE